MAPGDRALSSDTGKRLAKLLGMNLEEMLNLCDTDNLIREYPGSAGKWDRFPKQEALRGARRIWRRLGEYDLVLAVGQRVGSTLGVEPFEILTIGQTTLTCVPHTGGTNRWWNEPENRARGEEHLQWIGRSILGTA